MFKAQVVQKSQWPILESVRLIIVGPGFNSHQSFGQWLKVLANLTNLANLFTRNLRKTPLFGRSFVSQLTRCTGVTRVVTALCLQTKHVDAWEIGRKLEHDFNMIIHVSFSPNHDSSGSSPYYRPQTKFAKVMFLQVSVCPRGEGEVLGGTCMADNTRYGQ